MIDPKTPVSAILPPTTTATLSIPTDDWRKITDAFARDRVENMPLAGMTVAIRKRGDVDWIQAYGLSDLDSHMPASPDTVYPIGSLSMQFTAAAILQLNERGLLDLHVPISLYLGGLPEELQSLTLRQLMTHTSLIHDSAFDVQPMYFSDQDFTSETLLLELVPNLQLASSDVQEVFSYGNYILAGSIIEKVSGMSYPQYLNQYVFAPPGLQHTSYCLPPPPGLSRGYYLANGFTPLPINVSAVFAAGGICSTASDMLGWVDALTGGRVVSPMSYQKMITTPQLQDGSASFFGYGLYSFPSDHGLQVGSLGFEASYVSIMIVYPEQGLNIVLLSNTAHPGNDLLQAIWEKIPILMSN